MLTWGHGLWVADTSAWARAADPAVSANWKAAAAAGMLVGCPIVTLELLYDAPDREHVETVASALAGLRDVAAHGRFQLDCFFPVGSATSVGVRALGDQRIQGALADSCRLLPAAMKLVREAVVQAGAGVGRRPEHKRFEDLEPFSQRGERVADEVGVVS